MSSARCLFLVLSFVFCLLSCFLLLCASSIMSENLPNQVQIGAIEACQMDDLLYPERSIDHLDFSPIKGIFCIQYFFVRLHLFSDCLRNEKFFKKS